jgi:hypothetical protein
MYRVVVAFLLFSAAVSAQPDRFELPASQRTGSIRKIFVLHHSHLDIGFTLPADQVARDYKDSIDTAVRLVRENPDFRWTIESAWMLQQWLLRTQDEKAINELGTLMREGRISLGVAFGNMHSGLLGSEEMNRLVYLGESFRKRFGVKGAVAYQNDVPGFSWAYPRIFAQSGVKYLITGLNLFIGGGNDLGVKHTPFYWVGPDGSRVDLTRAGKTRRRDPEANRTHEANRTRRAARSSAMWMGGSNSQGHRERREHGSCALLAAEFPGYESASVPPATASAGPRGRRCHATGVRTVD